MDIVSQDYTENESLRVVSVPPELPLDSFPMPRKQITTPIAAGRIQGQQHPRYYLVEITIFERS